MRITALVKAPDHVCCRYRLEAFRPFLERAGHQLELRPWPRPWVSWLPWRRELGSADVIVFQRRLLPKWQLSLLRRAADLLLFDFDDAVFLRDSYSAKGLHSAGRAQAFAATVRAVDAVLAGNTFLGDQAALWTEAERVHLVPTCVDPGRYPLAEHRRVNAVQLVWIGSSSTLRGLEQARPLLDGLGRRWPGLRFKVICDRFPRLRELAVDACPWSQATEAKELAGADVGISWLPDDLWSRGKCSLKVLQYMAAGLPVVANPVGLQAQVVRHGENGFLAETPEQWAEAIGRLASDPALRQRLGQTGREQVEKHFSVSKGAAHWLALLDRLGNRRIVERGSRGVPAH